MNKKKIFLTAIYLLVISISIFSESAALILNYFEISDEEIKKETEDQIKQALEKELKRQNLEYRDESYVASALRELNISGKDIISEENALQLGQTAGVPVVVTIEAVDRENFLEFVVTAWDIEGQKKIASDRKVSRSSITTYIMINSSISSVASKLTGEYGIASITVEPKVRKITFISNQEGLQVYMADGEYLGEIVFSVLNVTDREFDIGTTLVITKKLKGYRDADQYVILDSEKSAVPLGDLKKAQTIALEFNWTYMQLMGLGAGIRYYAVPDWMYMGFDNYFYLQKDFSSAYGNETIHNDMRILAGVYIGLGPESIFRVSISVGAGLILSYPLDRSGVFTDFYINAVNLSLELNLENWSFYLRPELKIALGIGENHLHEGGIVLSEYNVPSITLGVLRKW